jgi:PAS domain S-box-containing protein
MVEITSLNQPLISQVQALQTDIQFWGVLQKDYQMLKFKPTYIQSQSVWEEKVKKKWQNISDMIKNNDIEDDKNNIAETRKALAKLEALDKKIVFFVNKNLPVKNELNLEFDNQLQKTKISLQDFVLQQELVFRKKVDSIKALSEGLFYLTIFVFILLFVFILGMNYWFSTEIAKVARRINRNIKTLIGGNLPERFSSKWAEFDIIINTTNDLNGSFERLQALAEEIGMEKYKTDLRIFGGKGELGASITRMRETLAKIANMNFERNFYNEGFAKFSEILRLSSRDSKIFYEDVISNLTRYVNGAQGGIFIIKNNNHEPYMELQASYAYDRLRSFKRTIYPSEGIVGQAWREKDKVYIDDIPDSFSEIVSCIGKAKPKSVLVIPLIINESVNGVIELSSFTSFLPYQIDFVERLSESIASTIARLNVDNDTKRLLSESQEMTHKMREQEEEMLNNMETLIQTQNVMEQNSNEMKLRLEALEKSFLVTEMTPTGFFTFASPLMEVLSGYSFEEVIGEHNTILFGTKVDNPQLEKDWRRVLNGEFVQGEYVRLRKDGKPYWVYEILYPLYNNQKEIYKICSVGYDISRQKYQEQKIREQLTELQMSKRDVVNRIREVENKSKAKLQTLQQELLLQIKEKDMIIQQMKEQNMMTRD